MAERYLFLTSRLLLLFGFFVMGSVLGQALGLAYALNLIGFDPSMAQDVGKVQTMMMDFIQHPEKYFQGYRAMMALQWFSALGSFVLSGWLFNRWVLRQHLSELSPSPLPSLQIIFWAILAQLLATPLMEGLIEWNKSLRLPEAYALIEQQMQATEKQLETLTKFLLNFQDGYDFATAILVVAFLAALGEELFFRGVLQNLFERYLGNAHVAIWLTAFIFSFIHFQFYGFFPRLILGAFFGYLYVWFRSLWLPMFCHFINNFIPLLLTYLHQFHGLGQDPMKSYDLPLWTVFLSGLAVSLLIRRLYQVGLNR